MSTKIYTNQFSETSIILLQNSLDKMKSHQLTIKDFLQLVSEVEKLHKIQLEIIEMEEKLDLPPWNGDYQTTNNGG